MFYGSNCQYFRNIVPQYNTDKPENVHCPKAWPSTKIKRLKLYILHVTTRIRTFCSNIFRAIRRYQNVPKVNKKLSTVFKGETNMF